MFNGNIESEKLHVRKDASALVAFDWANSVWYFENFKKHILIWNKQFFTDKKEFQQMLLVEQKEDL